MNDPHDSWPQCVAFGCKKRWPDMFKRYQESCWSHEFTVGNPLIDKGQNPWIILFPAKYRHAEKLKLDCIRESLKPLAERIVDWGVESIATPLLGAGLGDTDELLVYRAMQEALAGLSIPIEVRIIEDSARALPAQDFFWSDIENNPLYMEGATDAAG